MSKLEINIVSATYLSADKKPGKGFPAGLVVVRVDRWEGFPKTYKSLWIIEGMPDKMYATSKRLEVQTRTLPGRAGRNDADYYTAIQEHVMSISKAMPKTHDAGGVYAMADMSHPLHTKEGRRKLSRKELEQRNLALIPQDGAKGLSNSKRAVKEGANLIYKTKNRSDIYTVKGESKAAVVAAWEKVKNASLVRAALVCWFIMDRRGAKGTVTINQAEYFDVYYSGKYKRTEKQKKKALDDLFALNMVSVHISVNGSGGKRITDGSINFVSVTPSGSKLQIHIPDFFYDYNLSAVPIPREILNLHDGIIDLSVAVILEIFRLTKTEAVQMERGEVVERLGLTATEKANKWECSKRIEDALSRLVEHRVCSRWEWANGKDSVVFVKQTDKESATFC